MEKTLTFTQIADNRFGEYFETLATRDKQIKIAIFNLPGVKLIKESDVRKLYFKEDIIQWRKNYFVQKNRKTTWEKIYGAINNIKAVPYFLT